MQTHPNNGELVPLKTYPVGIRRPTISNGHGNCVSRESRKTSWFKSSPSDGLTLNAYLSPLKQTPPVFFSPPSHHKAKGGCWDLLWCTYSCWIFSLCCWHLLCGCEPRTAFRSSACVAEIWCEPRTALDLQPVMLPSCLLSFFFRPFESSRS